MEPPNPVRLTAAALDALDQVAAVNPAVVPAEDVSVLETLHRKTQEGLDFLADQYGFPRR